MFDVIIDIDSHFEPGDDWLDAYPELAARLPELDPSRLATDAIVGDLIRGGVLSSETPTTHFFMCDLEDNLDKIRRLAEMPRFATWYPGHFGPFSADAVRGYLGSGE